MDQQRPRCEAIKKDGLQCTMRCAKGKRLCSRYHANSKTTITDAHEPWTLKGLPIPDARNGKRVLQKIRTKLLKGPKEKDKGGSIYIYRFKEETAYYKIGKTRQSVDTRIKEWVLIHNRTVVLCDSFEVEKGLDFVEALIHIYLAYCNLHRTPHGKGHHSVLSLHNIVVDDGQQHTKEDKERLTAKSKHVEWFFEDLKQILKIVEPIIKLYG